MKKQQIFIALLALGLLILFLNGTAKVIVLSPNSPVQTVGTVAGYAWIIPSTTLKTISNYKDFGCAITKNMKIQTSVLRIPFSNPLAVEVGNQQTTSVDLTKYCTSNSPYPTAAKVVYLGKDGIYTIVYALLDPAGTVVFSEKAGFTAVYPSSSAPKPVVCSDGTALNQCSSSKGLACGSISTSGGNLGILKPASGQCGCPNGFQADGAGVYCVAIPAKPVPTTCDGVPIGSCGLTQPSFCTASGWSTDASCGCPDGMEYKDNTCKPRAVVCDTANGFIVTADTQQCICPAPNQVQNGICGNYPIPPVPPQPVIGGSCGLLGVDCASDGTKQAMLIAGVLIIGSLAFLIFDKK